MEIILKIFNLLFTNIICLEAEVFNIRKIQ